MSTTTPSAATPQAHPAAPASRARRRVVLGTLAGTTVEFYDFYLHATAAVAVFPALFFPAGESNAALLASMATFGAAFVARPIGSVLFGHLGDRLGRKASLLLSLWLMGAATVAIGLLPSYQQVGLWAPALLTVLRFCQGLGLSGEWTGATVLSAEHGAPGRGGRAAMWPQLGAPLGFLLANGSLLALMAVLGDAQDSAFIEWAWRVPFLASLLMVLIGWWVRSRIEDSPALAAEASLGRIARRPVLEVLRTHGATVLRGAGAMLAMYVIFYLMIAWSLSYALRPGAAGGLGLGYADVVTAQLLGVPLFALAVLCAGELSDRLGAWRACALVAALVLCFGLSFPWIVPGPAAAGDGGSALTPWDIPWELQGFLWAGMTLMGLCSGTASALLPGLFPARVRFSGVGLASNLSALVGAAATPYLALWLQGLGGVRAVGLYLAAAALLTLLCALASRRSRA